MKVLFVNDILSTTYESIRCLVQFGQKCLPIAARQALNMFVYNLRKVVLRRCRGRKARSGILLLKIGQNSCENFFKPPIQFNAEFLSHSNCWTPKEKLGLVKKCVDRHIAQLEYISNNVDPEIQFGAICCTFHQRMECIEREMSSICDKSDIKYAMDIIDHANGRRLTDFVCTKFTSVRVCDKRFDIDVWLPIKNIGLTDDNELIRSIQTSGSSLKTIIAIVGQFQL